MIPVEIMKNKRDVYLNMEAEWLTHGLKYSYRLAIRTQNVLPGSPCALQCASAHPMCQFFKICSVQF